MADTKTKGTREWYQAQLRKFAQRERWPMANRLDYLYQLLLNYIETYPTMEEGPDKVWLLKWTDYIKRSCVYAMMQKQSGNFGGIYWSVLKIEAQHRQLDSYMLFLERKRQAGTRFYEPRRKILVKFGVIQALQDLLDDKLDILALSMPPGAGKSTLEIFMMSGVLGWYPEMPNLLSSFSGTMTKSLYDGVCQILADKDEYEWHTLFPNVEFDLRSGTNSKDQTINVGKPKRFKSLTCRAIGASLTGSTRCEYLLCADDLCSGIEEAMSIDRLNKLWQAYNTDLKTRKKDRAKELHIATRWSVHDVIGRLQEANRANPRARFLSVPALDDNGESNFQYAGGVGFSTAYFQDIKNSMDDVSFKCLFMNEPIEREGLLYHDDEIRRYVTLPIAEPDAVLSVVDTKNKGTDYFFQPVFLKYGEDYYLADCICSDNSDYETQYARSAKIILDYEVQACKFESNNGGDRVALEVSNRVKEAKGYCNITQEYTTQNKETQIIVYAPWVKQHVIFRDRSLYQPKDDYGIMMSFLLGHAAMGKNKHDDVPDGLSSFAKWRSRPEDIPVIVGRRPF